VGCLLFFVLLLGQVSIEGNKQVPESLIADDSAYEGCLITPSLFKEDPSPSSGMGFFVLSLIETE
jgi:hypothetical protein